MKNNRILSFFISLLFSISGFSQLESVIVETYYISDNNDSTDIIGGKLDAGSTTYRIYVDLKKGSKLKKIYGDVNHPLKFSSTDYFYNNLDGQSFAKDFIKGKFGEGTIALDTWLTLGQTSKKQGGKTCFGILKEKDRNGSFIGGVNNDGGSALVSTGLLNNQSTSAGIPLTTSDGMDTMNLAVENWFNSNFGNDSTIFGSITPKKSFNSKSFVLSNNGTTGVIPEQNQILVAQLTTKGELSFELNFEVDALRENGTYETIKYVAKDSALIDGEKYSPFLRYPFVCGCLDANYLEFSNNYACNEQSKCINPVVIGCMDTLACNFDATANLNEKNMCCYPGKCANRDISIVCPSLRESSFKFDIHPNPTDGNIFLNVENGIDNEIKYSVYNTFGIKVLEKNIGANEIIVNEEIDLSTLNNGLYLIRVEVGEISDSQLFIKGQQN